jgi:hypothetical protein
LEWHNGNVWRAAAMLVDEELQEIEYKYACIQPDAVRWEDGQNRRISLSTGEPKGEKLYFDRSEWWQDNIY